MFALDPMRVREDGGRQIASLLFDGLVTLDRNEHVEPWGAQSWTISPDGLTYTFKLRVHQRFSDGAPVTASDYAWSIDRAAHTCSGSQVADDLAAIKGADVLSGYSCDGGTSETTLIGRSIRADDSANTLTILLTRPAPYFLSVLATTAGMALERRVVEKHVLYGSNPAADDAFLPVLSTGPTGQGGSGMFYLAKSSTSAINSPGSLALKQNPYWWGGSSGRLPWIKTIDITVPSADVAFSQFSSDPSQAFANSFPTDQPLAQYTQQPYYHEQPTLGFHGLMFYWRNAPFNDINARKAFCLAINRVQLNQQVYHGQTLPSWHIVPQGMDGYDSGLKGLDGTPITGDVSLAKHYWQLYLAAHNNQVPPIVINYGYPNNSRDLAVSAWLQNTWNQAFGPDTASIDRSEWGHGPGWQNSRQIVGFGLRADDADPQNILSWFAELNSGNVDGSPQIDVLAADALMRQADALSDMRQRIPLYQQAEQLLIDNVVVCPLYQTVNHYALRPWVKGGFAEDARGLFPNDAWVSGYIAKH